MSDLLSSAIYFLSDPPLFSPALKLDDPFSVPSCCTSSSSTLIDDLVSNEDFLDIKSICREDVPSSQLGYDPSGSPLWHVYNSVPIDDTNHNWVDIADQQFQISGERNSELSMGNSVDWRNYTNPPSGVSTEGGQSLGNLHYGFDTREEWAYRYGDSTHSDREVLPGVTVSTDAAFEAQARLSAYVRGAVDASLSLDEIHAHLTGEAGASAEASVDGSFNPNLNIVGLVAIGANSQGHADAFAGTQASGVIDTTLSWDSAYFGASGSAFAGTNASASGSQSFTVNGQELAEVHGGVGVQAGIGAEATFDIGVKNGVLHYDLGAGLALGVGLEFRLGGSIDLNAIVDTASDVLDLGADLVTDPLGTTSELVSGVWDLGTGLVSSAVDLGVDLAENVLDVGVGIAESALDVGVDLAENVLDVGVSIAEGVLDVGVDLAEDVLDVGSGIVEDTLDLGAEIVLPVLSQGSEAAKYALNGLGFLLESGASVAAKATEAVVSTVKKVMPWNW
jgi:hypothetical protein